MFLNRYACCELRSCLQEFTNKWLQKSQEKKVSTYRRHSDPHKPHIVNYNCLYLNEITHLRHFFKTLSIIFTIEFCILILFSETLIISKLPAKTAHGFRKITESIEASMSEPYSTGMATANHIRAPASWLVTAAPRNWRSVSCRATPLGPIFHWPSVMLLPLMCAFLFRTR